MDYPYKMMLDAMLHQLDVRLICGDNPQAHLAYVYKKAGAPTEFNYYASRAARTHQNSLNHLLHEIGAMI